MDRSVGVIGAGQLARMMVAPAIELGIPIRILAEAAGAPATVTANTVGDFHDEQTVMDFARGVDVVTFDHEHVPQAILQAVEAAGVHVRPGSAALHFAQDKLAMRERMSELGLPVPDWAAVRTRDEVAQFLAGHHGRAVVKLPVGGYDGHGVRFIDYADEVADWMTETMRSEFPRGVLIEEAVPFRRELSQLSARRPSGEFRAWDLAESVQRDGVCVEVVAPAPGASAQLAAEAAAIAREVAEALDVVGVLAVELFEAEDGRLLINELAMRPHNTGHWTMDGAVTGQFEQHLRAVLDVPLGETRRTGAAVAMVNVLGGPKNAWETARADALALDPEAKLHWYDKTYRPGRKVGHVNVVSAAGASDALSRAVRVARALEAEKLGEIG